MQVQKSPVTYPPHFNKYIDLVKSEDLNFILSGQAKEAESFFNEIPAEKWYYKYEVDKWSIKEVVQHITDTERVFSYRALAFSRKDPNIIPSFDENEYTKNSNACNKDSKDLIEEFLAVRKSDQLLFKGFSEEQLNTMGKASSYEMDVKSIGYMIAGHFAHHIKILNERYLR